jgi:hypothetical protein
MADQHRRRRAAHAAEIVMLGQPVSPIAPPLRMARQVERVGKGLRGRAALQDRRKVEDGEGDLPAFCHGLIL